MNEKPIIFSSEMVKAILDGRKTQTRRVIKPQPTHDDGSIWSGRILGPEMYSPVKIDKNGDIYPGPEIFGIYDEYGEWGRKCPYGKPGDLLWVRETWRPLMITGDDLLVEYRADRLEQNRAMPSEYRIDITDHWRPPIYMPHWASRITLRVIDVRAERVRDISAANAIAEGIETIGGEGETKYIEQYPGQPKYLTSFPITAFSAMWDYINLKRGYGWNVNPWVWVVKFERVNGDE